MKKNLLFCLITLFILSSCQKSTELKNSSQENPSLKEAKDFLKTQVNQYEFGMLDWQHAAFYRKGSKTEIISVPLKNSSEKKSAYVFFADNKISGNWVVLEIGTGNLKYKKIISEAFNGKRVGVVNIADDGRTNAIDIYENGVLINHMASRTSVVVVQVPASIAGPNFTALLLEQYLGLGHTDWNTGLVLDESQLQLEYLQPDQGGGGGYEIYLDILFDYSNSGPGIDLQKYFNCFDLVPDNGATYSIKLSADLPSNNEPDIVAVGMTPGHAFVTITKSNGSQSVKQSFGFYPQSGPLSVFGSPVPSKIVDDGQHEYNASILMNNISQSDFNTLKNLILAGAGLYDITDFNCADYALTLFNSIRSSTIDIPDTWAPLAYYGTTPNGIYIKLKDMKDGNHAEAANIQIGVYNSPTSHGPCN